MYNSKFQDVLSVPITPSNAGAFVRTGISSENAYNARHNVGRSIRKNMIRACERIWRALHLRLSQLPQTTNGTPHCSGRCRSDGPCASCDSLFTRTTPPDTDCLTFNGVLSTKRAGITSVLCYFHLFHLLAQGGTITSAVLSGHTNFARTFGHLL